MKHHSRVWRAVLTLALAALAAACSTGPRPQVEVAPVHTTDKAEIETIAGLLDGGHLRSAKQRIAAALKRDPGNANLLMLRDSIERDPKDLLGPNSYAYTVQQGDTIAGLAQRLLGNRLKSHQLARYNGTQGAAVLIAGQSLRIPGEPPRAEPVKRPERSAEPRSPARSKLPPATGAPAVAAQPAVSDAKLTAARQARSAGLAALNDGNPARAVSLLSRAAALEPGNPAIQRDLQRAQRINATVQSRQ